MKTPMFCFQCEQTACGTGCTAGGVCGKRPDVAQAQDALTGALVALAARTDAADVPARADLVERGLFTTVTNVSFDKGGIDALAAEARAFGAGAYDMARVWEAADLDIRSLKSLLLFGLRGLAAYAHHARVLGRVDPDVEKAMFRHLALVGSDAPADDLLAAVLDLGKAELAVMKLLDAANTGAYGTPAPTRVSRVVEPGPFVVVTGHDLADLDALCGQADRRGVAVYTHGEMLPCHAYPKLKAHPSLKGHFGTAWQNQQKEFDALPGAILYTTNCLMPPRESYADRVFTTGVVAWPGARHIGPGRDFTAVLDKAAELGGYREPVRGRGANGGEGLTTGFAHAAVLGVADKVVAAVKSGALRRIFVVGGCDGAKPGRNYFTELVMKTPPDTLVLTCACGKFRFNDLDLGTVAGLPRLLDAGQCNDAYSAIAVAAALAEAFRCGVNDLPLSIVLSWYEQKAVSVLLALLSLSVKDIRLGPTMPAFLSPNVAAKIVELFGLKPATTPDADLAAMLA